jgi:hypothetical protein
MDSLSLPGSEAPTFIAAASLLPPAEMVTSRMVATFAGRKSVVAHDPRIRRIVERLVAERRAPMAGEVVVLKNALRDVRRRAGLGSLEAAAAQVSDDAGIISDDGLVMLTYLDRAMAQNLPFDMMLSILNLAVDGADTSAPLSRPTP